MSQLPDQLSQRQQALGIKNGELAVEEVSDARVGLVGPLFGYGESASCGTLQGQCFYTGDRARFKNDESFAFQRMKGMGNLSTIRKRAVVKCSWL
jgi:hypothetical protein